MSKDSERSEEVPQEEVDPNKFAVGPWPEEGYLIGRFPEDLTQNGPIVITNEFADVVITRVRTRNGERLDIWSPRRGSRVQLDAVELDGLTMQPQETFTELIERVT